MSYSDQKFYARELNLVADSGVATATYTVSGSNAATSSIPLPTFNRRSVVNAVKLVTKAIPTAGLTANHFIVLNGTATLCDITITSATLGQELNGTLTSAVSTFAAAAGATVKIVGTATASGNSAGAYEVFFETQELFS